MCRFRWLLLICCLFLRPHSAAGDSEALLNEVNRLAPAEREKRLVESAKKEARVLVYSSENITLLSAYEAAFTKKYPFIKLEYWRAGGDRVGARVMTESRAGQLQGDLIGLAFDVAYEIKSTGILARYDSPERKFFADYFKDREGYFTPTNLIHAIIGYNTNLVGPTEVPKDYPDLLNPKWKGKLSIDTEPSRAVMGWLKAWGEEKTRAYLQGLVKNGVAVTRGHSLQTQFVCAGQYAVAVELYLYTVAGMQRTGCPIGIAYPNPTTVASAQSWALPKAAPRPYAAALFLDFILSAEGSALVADEGRIPARSGVKPKFDTLNQVASGKVPVQVLSADDAHRFDGPADKLVKELLLK